MRQLLRAIENQTIIIYYRDDAILRMPEISAVKDFFSRSTLFAGQKLPHFIADIIRSIESMMSPSPVKATHLFTQTASSATISHEGLTPV
jgi:hypothetical protein